MRWIRAGRFTTAVGRPEDLVSKCVTPIDHRVFAVDPLRFVPDDLPLSFGGHLSYAIRLLCTPDGSRSTAPRPLCAEFYLHQRGTLSSAAKLARDTYLKEARPRTSVGITARGS